MITIEQAKTLKPGDIIHSLHDYNADGTPQRWRVNGQVKLWKRSPDRFQIPVKYGLYDHGYVTQDNAWMVVRSQDDRRTNCPRCHENLSSGATEMFEDGSCLGSCGCGYQWVIPPRKGTNGVV